MDNSICKCNYFAKAYSSLVTTEHHRGCEYYSTAREIELLEQLFSETRSKLTTTQAALHRANKLLAACEAVLEDFELIEEFISPAVRQQLLTAVQQARESDEITTSTRAGHDHY